MKKIDAHVHVFGVLKGFRGEGELYPLGNGKARWANGQVVEMIPPGLGDCSFETEACFQFLKEKGIEKAVLLQKQSGAILTCLQGQAPLTRLPGMRGRFMTGSPTNWDLKL